MTDKPTLTLDELGALFEKQNKPDNLSEDKLLESAVSALNSLRGLSRSDKIKVIKRMRKLLDA